MKPSAHFKSLTQRYSTPRLPPSTRLTSTKSLVKKVPRPSPGALRTRRVEFFSRRAATNGKASRGSLYGKASLQFTPSGGQPSLSAAKYESARNCERACPCAGRRRQTGASGGCVTTRSHSIMAGKEGLCCHLINAHHWSSWSIVLRASAWKRSATLMGSGAPTGSTQNRRTRSVVLSARTAARA